MLLGRDRPDLEAPEGAVPERNLALGLVAPEGLGEVDRNRPVRVPVVPDVNEAGNRVRQGVDHLVALRREVDRRGGREEDAEKHLPLRVGEHVDVRQIETPAGECEDEVLHGRVADAVDERVGEDGDAAVDDALTELRAVELTHLRKPQPGLRLGLDVRTLAILRGLARRAAEQVFEGADGVGLAPHSDGEHDRHRSTAVMPSLTAGDGGGGDIGGLVCRCCHGLNLIWSGSGFVDGAGGKIPTR